MRILHTMIRVGDLQRSIDFYTGVMGMELLRTTDRPEQKYKLAFVGYGDESKGAVLELTYNYGVDEVRSRRRLRPHRHRRARCRGCMRGGEGKGRNGHARGGAGEGRHDA